MGPVSTIGGGAWKKYSHVPIGFGGELSAHSQRRESPRRMLNESVDKKDTQGISCSVGIAKRQKIRARRKDNHEVCLGSALTYPGLVAVGS